MPAHVEMTVMEAAFEAKPIGAEKLRMAYALMLLGTPDMSFAEFKKWAAGASPGRLGGIFDRRGYIHGLFRSRVETKANNVRRLIVSGLILSDALSSKMTSHMLDSLVRAAHAQGCDHMTVEAPTHREKGHRLLEILENRGFVDESVLMAARV